MLKLIHISDFHLNKANLDDWNSFVKKAFIDLAKREFPDGNAIIICTGDLIDQGGKEFGGVSAALKKFKDAVIDPVILELNIPVSNFVCIPGNHDINRFADDEIEVNGLKALLAGTSIEKVNTYAKSLSYDSPQHSKRVSAYKQFEKELYSGCDNVSPSFLGSSFIIPVGTETVGIAAFNTVWNCSDDNDKENGICLSEPQYLQCKDNIKDCTYKVALMHHPLDWLTKENESIQPWMKQDFDVLLDGHVHKSDTLIETRVYGSLYIDTAPSFENDIRDSKWKGAFSNGVNIIRVNDDKTLVFHKECKYVHKQRTYPDVEEEVLNYVSVSSEEERIVNACIKYIKEKHYVDYDNSIIPHKASAIKTLKEAFVLPPISINGDNDERLPSLSGILNNTANVVLYGSHESGKTTLLYRMIIELIDNYLLYQTIPVFIDFESIGSRDIDTCIKLYLDCNSSEYKALIKAGLVTLFIDNYNPSETNKTASIKLHGFIKDNDIKIIATHNSELNVGIDMSFANQNKIAFETYHILPFNAENVRQLMVKWSPGGKFEETNSKIQKLVSNFWSYSLPCSAMSVSLYLWSTESTDKKPMNPALLLEIYLEIILEKLNPDYIYRDSFDYQNKIMLLASIAKYSHDELQKNVDFRLTYPQYLSCINDYLKAVGFEKVEADKLGNYFIEQKIFEKAGNYVNFSHSCFYCFLLAKRMYDEPAFKKHVLSDTQYYKYERVIDYYAGLNRSNRELLSEILNRFNSYFSPLDEFQSEINKDMDNCFTIIKQGESFIPMIDRLELKTTAQDKGQQEDVEKRTNKVFDERLSKIADTYASPKVISAELMIVMLCKALRNLDGVEDVDLKTQAYISLVKHSLQHTFILKDYLARFANHNQNQLPVAFSFVNNIPQFFRYMPYSLECSFHDMMGSTKLFTPIKKKIEMDKADKHISDIERFFSVALLWDSTGLENEKEIKKLIRSVGNNCVQDYILNKVYYRFKYLVSVGSEEEQKCISLLADLKVKGNRLQAFKKGKIMADIKKERENYFKLLK